MAKRDEFDRSLEDVFEDRAPDFSSDLRELLEKLWLEGVRQGRALERLETHDLERALELGALEPGAPDPRALLESSSQVIVSSSSSGRTLEAGELTLEQITRAADELRRLPQVQQLPRIPSFGLGALEERMRLETLAQAALEGHWPREPSSGLELASNSRWSPAIPSIEIMGTWSDTDE